MYGLGCCILSFLTYMFEKLSLVSRPLLDTSPRIYSYYDLAIKHEDDGDGSDRRRQRHSRQSSMHKIVVTLEEKKVLKQEKVDVHFAKGDRKNEFYVMVGAHSSEVIPVLARRGFRQEEGRSITLPTRKKHALHVLGSFLRGKKKK